MAMEYLFTAPVILLVEFALALALAVYLIYKYANLRRQNPFVTGCTLLVWFLSFVIIFLLPVDVSSVSALSWSQSVCSYCHLGGGGGVFPTYEYLQLNAILKGWWLM